MAPKTTTTAVPRIRYRSVVLTSPTLQPWSGLAVLLYLPPVGVPVQPGYEPQRAASHVVPPCRIIPLGNLDLVDLLPVQIQKLLDGTFHISSPPNVQMCLLKVHP